MTPFDLTGELPTGTTLLEASAGTGKTYAIAALATRYVAEGHATIDQLLMVTFGRAATRELRERVREALTRARDALRLPESTRTGHPGTGRAGAADPVLAMLLALPDAERSRAAERLASAVAGFDAATIATTHQFCLHALSGLGIAADTDPAGTFVEDVSAVVDEVVDDFYVRKYGVRDAPEVPDLTLADARAIARTVVGDPQSALHRGTEQPGSADETRVRFAEAVRAEVVRRRRARGLVTFDDLVLRLEAALLDPVTGRAARRRLQEAYRVVLVDEFQDTDPAQWRIVATAFHGTRTLVLIGDPKQAIYAFRGADVISYLEAATAAHQRATLGTNHRSDAPLVNGIAELMGGLELGDPRILVHPVTAARPTSRLSGTSTPARVRLRTLRVGDGEVPPVAQARERVAADLAADVVATLSGPARLDPGDGTPIRPVQPGDIAVLVATNRQGDVVHRALAALGVPAVVSAPRSVFATPAAAQWQTLLRALEGPRRAAVRAAALTDFVGRTAAELALAGDALDVALGTQVREWGHVLQSDGVAALLGTMAAQTELMPRVLARPDGERHLTDLRHVAGALHARQRETRGGITELLGWLDEQVARTSPDATEQTTERTRRLETDAAAVQVLTVHRSKGLEFPIVYVPFGWDRFTREPDLLRCHHDGRRVLDVRTPRAPGRSALVAAHRAEESGESLRLLYVALTRAGSAVVAHWAPGRNSGGAPLTRVLGARAAGARAPAPSYDGTRAALAWLAGSTTVSIEPMPDRVPTSPWVQPAGVVPELAAAPWTRTLDSTWRRTSYTGLTSGLHGPEQAPPGFRDDEPDGDGPNPAGGGPERVASEGSGPERVAPEGSGPEQAARGHPDVDPMAQGSQTPSPFADLPGGTAFGTLVHAVLEAVDVSAPDLADELAQRCARAVAARPVPGVDPGALAAALMPVLQTPLGPLAGARSLAGIPSADRLAELGFELPMGGSGREGGDGADGAATLHALADLLRRHLPDDDPMRAYPDRLIDAGIGGSVLRGYLTGSIDAVLRVPDGTGAHRHLVVDYKTNLARTPGAEAMQRLAWGYRPSVLPEAMMAAHYPLQALLYSAALHRYLRWRLPGYRPAEHLGGVLYLFLRGMAGPDVPTEQGQPCGVCAWHPPAGLVVAVSDLLDGRLP